jgi:hypothetical protein
LTSLPDNLSVQGNLYLAGCTSLQSLPDNLSVQGDLDLSGCTSLQSLPDNLSVQGKLYLTGCTSLQSLPDNLSVQGKLYLTGCTGLTSLPDNLSFQGNLYLRDCTSLESLPDNLSVQGYLDLSGCTSLESLPENLSVKGDLDLSGCTSLQSLPDNLSVKGDLDLSGCTSLQSLPDNLSVQGKLYLAGCTRLTTLPDTLSVQGNLDLSGCTTLESLPDNLSVQGSLVLTGCTSLQSLPENLSVQGDLYPIGCTSLQSLPENLSVQGDLNLRNCTGLTSLPSAITQWGPRGNRETRIIDLTGTGLSDDIIRRLQESNALGIQFHFSQRAETPSHQFSSIEEGLLFWAGIANKEQIPQVEILDNSSEVIQFLDRLTSTSEYKNQQTRVFLANRIMDVFDAMNEQSEIKDRAVDMMFYGLTTCDDRIISALNEIELMIRIYEIEKGGYSEQALKDLGKSFLLLEMVNKKAEAHIQTLNWVDELEVYLAFQIGLADRFNLPIKTRNMIFRGYAQIRDEQIDAIGTQIETECTEEKLESFLQKWNPWLKYQRESKIPSYEDLPVDEETKFKKGDICIISQEEPEKPVSYKGTVYNHEHFIDQFKTNGTNPMNPSEKIDIKLLNRISK